jgi:hypothetical protein
MSNRPDSVNWTKKAGTAVLLFIGMMVMVGITGPNAEVSGIATHWDFIFIFVIIGLASYFGAWAYWVFRSPQLFSETTRVSTSTNRVFPVQPDDARLPKMLLIPWGGYSSEGWFTGRPDMGSSGGVFIVPHYLVEKVGKTVMIHGEALLLSHEAVSESRWITRVLEQFEEYKEGETAVYTVISGSGPPLDKTLSPEDMFNQQNLLSLQSETNRKIQALAEKAVSRVTNALRIASDAWREEAATRILTKQEEMKRTSEEPSTGVEEQ